MGILPPVVANEELLRLSKQVQMVLQSGGQADLTSENGVVYYRSLSRTATLLEAKRSKQYQIRA